MIIIMTVERSERTGQDNIIMHFRLTFFCPLSPCRTVRISRCLPPAGHGNGAGCADLDIRALVLQVHTANIATETEWNRVEESEYHVLQSGKLLVLRLTPPLHTIMIVRNVLTRKLVIRRNFIDSSTVWSWCHPTMQPASLYTRCAKDR